MNQLYQDLCEILPGVDCTLHSNKIRIVIGLIYTIESQDYNYYVYYTVKSIPYKINYNYQQVLKHFSRVNETYQASEKLGKTLISTLDIFNLRAEIYHGIYSSLQLIFYSKIFTIFQNNKKLSIESGRYWWHDLTLEESIKTIRTGLLATIVRNSRIKINCLRDEYLNLDFNFNLDNDNFNLFNLVNSIINQYTELLIDAI